MREAAHPPGCARCGAVAGRSAIMAVVKLPVRRGRVVIIVTFQVAVQSIELRVHS